MWCLHSAEWWRRHWERTGIVAVEGADTMPDGWRAWLDWQQAVAPDNSVEIRALEADRGQYSATFASSRAGAPGCGWMIRSYRCLRSTSGSRCSEAVSDTRWRGIPTST